MSARDPGAAHQILALANHFKAINDFSIDLVAMSPAYEILIDHGFSVRKVELDPAVRPNDQQARALLSCAKEIIEQILPDAILVGISGPDMGIDEALLASFSRENSYAFQDYWGDINEGFGNIANTFFVLDELAGNLTQKRIKPEPLIIVSGSPRHSGFTEISLDRKRTKQELMFCGQPLWHLSGYFRTIECLARSVSGNNGFCVRYRPHPKETPKQQDRILECFSSYGVNVELDSSNNLLQSIHDVTVLTSCYSSCGLDHAYLNRVSNFPLGGVAYLMFEDDVRDYYRAYSGLSTLPLVDMQLAIEVSDGDNLCADLQGVASSVWKKHAWHTAQTVLPPPDEAVVRIERQIRNDLAIQEK